MLQSLAIFVAAFAALASSTPTDARVEIERRDFGSCVYHDEGGIRVWTVKIGSSQDSGLCKGLWDNIGPHCPVTSTNCIQEDVLKTIQFHTPNGCGPSVVQDAIWIATSPNLGGVSCVFG